jgi:SAM-dependent methyltransferase
MNSALRSHLLSHRFSREAGSAVRLGREQRAFVDLVAGKLGDGGYRLLSDACPCGKSGSDVLLSEVDRYGLPLDTVLCSACGTLRTNPYLDAGSLADFYTHYYQQMYARSSDHAAYFAKQQDYGRRVLESVKDWLPAGALVFEAGCGAGGALEVLRQGGYQVGGCDYSRELVEYGRTTRGLDLHWGPPLDVLEAASVPGPLLIYMHHVFEHVRDPFPQLVGLRERLAPGGKVLLIVPDVTRIDEFPFPAGDLRLFLHIAHRFNFSLDGFRALAARAGFGVESLRQRAAHRSPELWVLLRRQPGASVATEHADAGGNMLAYLHRTERLRKFHLTRGQIVGLAARVRSKLVRVIRRTGSFFSTPSDGS